MGYTELERKRPIEIQGDFYDKILIYKYKGEVWGVCYRDGEIDSLYNYTKKDFHWSLVFEKTLKEIVKKVIQPLKRSCPGDYSMLDEHMVKKALKVDKL